MISDDKPPSIGQLLGDAMHQLSRLIQNEIHLARAEIIQKATVAETGIAFLAAAGLVSIAVMVMLLMATAIWLIEFGFSPVSAHFAAAVIGALVAAALAVFGLSRLKSESLTPRVTLQQLGRDIEAAKDMVK